jgi:hypothetical protein
MARAPSLPARGGAVVARTGETRLWWATLAVGVALCLAYAVTPVEHVIIRDFALYPLTDLLAAVAVLIGVRLYRPEAPWAWLLIAAYLLFSMAGDLTWGVYEAAGESFFIQGVWLPGEEEFVASGNAYASGVTDNFKSEIDDASAVVHGDAKLPERRGHASGTYGSDVSR